MTTTADKVRALLRDPHFRIRIYRSGWEETGNPVHVWEAVAVCTEHERPFPEWVMGYLATVAQLMKSDDARAATDLRAVLPKIMGFAAKPGPGRPLDPHGGKDGAMLLAILFAIEIEHGLKPSAALRKAAAGLTPDVLDRDERTLWRRLIQAVGLDRRPRTNAEWRAALRSHLGAFADLTEQAFADLHRARVSRDSG